MKNYKIGIIGGSGIYTLQGYKLFKEAFDHKYKNANLAIEKYNLDNSEIYFLPRHGRNHEILPHEISYLNNIKFFRKIGVDFIISFRTIGSLNSIFQPGTYIIPEDMIDFTKTRNGANYVEENKHVDIQEIFNETLITMCKQIFKNTGLATKDKGVLVVIDGPRFSTKAEQKMYRLIGGDFLNMTQAQEIYLSHVFKIPFISLCHITDLTSIADKDYNIKSNDAITVFKSNLNKVGEILNSLVEYLSKNNPEIRYHNDKQTFV